MHEMMKYFLLTENQQQFLNSEHVPDPANPAPICVILMRSSWYSCMLYLLYAVQLYTVQLYTQIPLSYGKGTPCYAVYCMLYAVCCILYAVCCMLYYSQKSCSFLNSCICAHFWYVYSLKELQMYGA